MCVCPRVCAVFVVFQFSYKHVNNFQLIAQIRRGLDFYCIARGAACRTNSQIHLRIPLLSLSFSSCLALVLLLFALLFSICNKSVNWRINKVENAKGIEEVAKVTSPALMSWSNPSPSPSANPNANAICNFYAKQLPRQRHNPLYPLPPLPFKIELIPLPSLLSPRILLHFIAPVSNHSI